MKGSRCRADGALFVPERDQCPGCGGPVDAVEVADSGTLRTWTVVRSAPTGHEASDRVVAVVDVDGAVFPAWGTMALGTLVTGASVAVTEAPDGTHSFTVKG